jgi:hypothetical protein
MAGTKVPRDDMSHEMRGFLDDLSRRTDLNNLPNAVNDAAAHSAGVAVGKLYRNGSILMIRVS